MFSSISRGVLRKSKADARLETGQSLLQSVGAAYLSRKEGSKEFPTGVKTQPFEAQSIANLTDGTGRDMQDPDLRRTNYGRSSPTGGSGYSPRILSIGGGKGGIGKSFVSANLAVCLAKKGFTVSLVDLDLGAANLHTCLGVPNPKVGIFDFVNEKIEDLRDIAVETGIPGLKLYGGGQEFWQQVRPQSVQKVRLISKLQSLDSDYVILDLGAGTHVNTLDFFIFSHAGLLVVVPEPTSIENAYVFLKSVMYRKLQSIIKAIREEGACQELLQMLGDPKVSTPPFAQLERFAERNPTTGNKIIQLIRMTRLGIVMNQVRTQADADIGNSMSKICDRYFGFNSRFLGLTQYDDEAWKSVRGRRPLCLDRPGAPSAQDIANLSNAISTDFLPAVRSTKESEIG
jgi:flagellar biosynthesis protein FlhG